MKELYPNRGAEVGHSLTTEELNLCREWFETVQDVTPVFLEKKDYILADKIYKLLKWRVPNSVIEKL